MVQQVRMEDFPFGGVIHDGAEAMLVWMCFDTGLDAQVDCHVRRDAWLDQGRLDESSEARLKYDIA